MRTFISRFLQFVGLLTIVGIISCIGLLAFAGYWMNVNEEPFKADYILPLAGDKNRLMKAIELYKEGYAPTLLASNAISYPPTPYDKLKWEIGYPKLSRDEMNQRILQAMGAGTARLESFGNGHISTVEEVEALKAFLKGQPAKILVVTSPYHARRAKMIFAEVLPECTVRVTVTGVGSFKKEWWKDQLSALYLIPEFAKTLHYLMGGVFRSTDQAAN